MRNTIAISFILLLLLLCGFSQEKIKTKPAISTAGSAAQPIQPQIKLEDLSVEQVIELCQAGLSEDLIIAKIKKNNRAFDLSAAQLLQLNKAGATDNTILILMDPLAQPKRAEPAPAQIQSVHSVIKTDESAKPAPSQKPVAESIKITAPVIKPANEDEFKQALKSRYDGKQIAVAVDGLMAGEFKRAEFGLGAGDAGLIWNHYHSSVEVPKKQAGKMGIGGLFGKKTADLDKLDEQTFANLTSGRNTSPLQRGELLKVNKFYVLRDRIDLDLIVTKVSHLKDMDMSKANLEVNTTRSGNQINQTVRVGEFGLKFSFYFDRDKILKTNDYETIVAEINKYFLPETEMAEILKAEKNIEIELGMTEADIIKKLGQPLKTLKVGNQKSLQFKQMTVILKDGVVVDVKLQ